MAKCETLTGLSVKGLTAVDCWQWIWYHCCSATCVHCTGWCGKRLQLAANLKCFNSVAVSSVIL